MSKRLAKTAMPRTSRTHRQTLSQLLRAGWPATRSGCAVAHRFTEPLEPRQLLAANVVINEIMYHPGYGNPGTAGYIAENVKEEYIELYNIGSSAANLEGWHFNQGIDYTFPNVTIQPGQFLVITPDLPTFQAKYPGVNNVIAAWADENEVHSWTGQLGNNGEDLELENNLGQRVDFGSYSSEGDWANRRLTIDENYPQGIKSWEWRTGADAGNKSLELINPGFSNEFGQNWTASLPDGGTPGAPNSIAASDIAPVIYNVKHFPVIPKPTDPVIITARVLDELGANATLSIHYRIDGTVDFTAVPMFDDGQHSDGIAGDGLYGGVLPPQPDKTIIEFYVQAADPGGKTRTWPAPSNDEGAEHAANALYQVDTTSYTGDQPIYRFIIPQAEYNAWFAQMGQGHPRDYSNALMNGTFISLDGAGSEQRYLVGVRNRGEGTRASVPHNFQVKFPRDNPWHNLTTIALNTQFTYAQVAGNALFSLAGLPAPYGKPIQVRVNSQNLANPTGRQYGSYFQMEPYNSEWAQTHFPSDSNGNIYKGVAVYSPDADLRYINDNPSSYRMSYFKQTNTSADDWSDLVELVRVLNTTPDNLYTQEVSRVVNVDEWLRYFVVNSLVGNRENSLGGVGNSGYLNGDDYSMYRGVSDVRFQLLIHDLDTVLGEGDYDPGSNERLFPASSSRVPTIDKFMKWPDFAPRYFQIFKEQIATTFSPERINPVLDQLLGGWVPNSTIQNMKQYAADRVTYVLSQIPQAISVTNPPASTTTSTVSLTGLANAITTRSVKVNGVAATWSAWEAKWTATDVVLHPGVNHILIQSFGVDGKETDHGYATVRYDKGPVTTVAGGTLPADTTWTAADGPYQLTSSLIIPSGRTLIIQPGTSVYLGNASSAVNITVASGGRLLAEGTDTQRIVFSGIPGATYNWGGIDIGGTTGSPETRITHTHIRDNGTTAIHSTGGTVFFDHLTFGTAQYQFISLDDSSFVVQDSEFPTPTGSFEPLHGTGGVKAGGRGIFLRNYFAPITGYNDTIDFTGGNRPNEPIVQFINNVFAGSGDDNIDVDGTDAWIEGNIFLHVHKNGSPDTSSAVSGGEDGGDTSEVTIIGNIFYDVDQAANAKQGNFFTFINNTIVRQTHQGGLDTDGGVVVMQDNGMTEARGMLLDGNIIYDAEKLVRDQVASIVTFNNNILPLPWTGPGTGNSIIDPAFKYLPKLSETIFTTWAQAQIMRDWFGLHPDSAAIGTGPNGADKGGVIPPGVSISGEPVGDTSQTAATLIVGPNRTGFSIPTAGWPNGSGYTHYKYRLDGGTWSAETPINTPISRTNLADGPHTVEVIGKSDAGWYQNDPIFGSSATITRSRTWTVDSSLAPTLRINEVLALNTTLDHNGSLPDMIELYNTGPGDINLSGYGITDNADLADKFIFPDGTVIPPGQYLILYADALTADGELHLGFNIKDEGDTITLFGVPGTNNIRPVIDSVRFGRQIANSSIGRLADASWALTKPTFGSANIAQPLGDPRSVKINEWLADEKVLFADDFIELYNPQSLPVAIGGFYLTDLPADLSRLHAVAPLDAARYSLRPLSFIPAKANAVYHADSNTAAGNDHVDFKLDPYTGMIGLLDPAANLIDQVIYGGQTTDVSQGRTPDGNSAYAFFSIPLPGVANPGIKIETRETIFNIIADIAADTGTWSYYDKGQITDSTWNQPGYLETAWTQGPAVLYCKAGTADTLAAPVRTTMAGDPNNLDSQSRRRPYATYYFRRRFDVAGDPTQITHISGRAVLDDGAVLYLNGVKLGTINVDPNAATITYTTRAQNTVSTANNFVDFSFPLTGSLVGVLKQTGNVLAVEVKQINATSSDVAWGATLAAKEVSTTTTITNNVPPNITNLMKQFRITELMYNPIGDSSYEFVELKNIGSVALDLAGVRLAGGIGFVFPATTLDPGQYVLVVANQLAFESRYGTGLNIAGQYTGVLANGGNNVVLQLPQPYDAAMLRFDYNPAWYPSTAGPGRSLVLIDPTQPRQTWADRVAWRASVFPGGSPAAPDLGDLPGSVVISEVLANFTNPFIEIHNTTTEPINIAGWFLSDDPANLTKFQIDPIAPETQRWLLPDQYLLFNALPFTLAQNTGAVYLSNATGSYRESFVYGPGDPGVSFGRYVKSDGNVDYVATSAPTPGFSNAYPLVGPVVITELMYNPLAGDEFIELHNITPNPITLHDPAFPDSAWIFTSGITFSFADTNQQVAIPAYGYLLVVPIDANTFRSKYNIPAAVQIYQWTSGKLDNAGERIALSRPRPGSTPLDYILVDAVFYDNNAPWPTASDGEGPALVRIDPGKYPNDLVNWAAASASPGLPNYDTAAPTASIAKITPNRRETGISFIAITFSEPVQNFDIDDLKLTRYGSSVSLAGATFTTDDYVTFTLANLLPLTSSQGQYTLTLTAASSGIKDLAGHAMVVDAAESFTVTALTIAGSAPMDVFNLRVASGNLEIYKNTMPESSPPTEVVALADLSLVKLSTGMYVAWSDLEGLKITAGGSVAEPTSLVFTTTQHLKSLSLNNAVAWLTVGGGKVLRTEGLLLSGEATLDLLDNAMIVQSTSDEREEVAAAILRLVKSGRTGPGIRSGKGTAMAGLAASANDKGGDNGPICTRFGGEDVDTASILVKYTWDGDSNFDGVVNADDYFQIDSGFISQKKGYYNGDFNYDGVVNADDYFLIDSSFIGSGGVSIAAAGDVVAVSAVKKPDASILAQLFSTNPVL